MGIYNVFNFPLNFDISYDIETDTGVLSNTKFLIDTRNTNNDLSAITYAMVPKNDDYNWHNKDNKTWLDIEHLVIDDNDNTLGIYIKPSDISLNDEETINDISFTLHDEKIDTSDNLYKLHYIIEDISNILTNVREPLVMGSDAGGGGGGKEELVDGTVKYVDIFDEIDKIEDKLALQIMFTYYFAWIIGIQSPKNEVDVLDSWGTFKTFYKGNPILLKDYEKVSANIAIPIFNKWMKNMTLENIY